MDRRADGRTNGRKVRQIEVQINRRINEDYLMGIKSGLKHCSVQFKNGLTLIFSQKKRKKKTLFLVALLREVDSLFCFSLKYKGAKIVGK